MVYIWSKSATPAKTHFDDFSLVFKLKVQIYVGPEKKRSLRIWQSKVLKPLSLVL